MSDINKGFTVSGGPSISVKKVNASLSEAAPGKDPVSAVMKEVANPPGPRDGMCQSKVQSSYLASE